MNRNPPLPTRTRSQASALRRTPTDAESTLWFHLRAGRLDGLKFRRQHPVPPYVVDFYCREAKLVVELDGSQHTDSADSTRTAALKRQGLFVARFWDNDVLQRTESVLAAILNAARTPTLTPTPLPVGEGLKTSAEQ
jgi:very-short-patch-repair endonuclease